MPITNDVVLDILPTKRSPRNSEGSFVTLAGGRILFAFWHFSGGGDDDSPGCIGVRHSDDGGRTWTQRTRVLLANEGKQTTGSVSFLRLASGKIALVYLVKDGFHECRPRLRLSDDEAKTWSDPMPIIAAPGYFTVNNDRIVQLSTGRLVVPAAFHRLKTADTESSSSFDHRSLLLWYLSDDEGATWREAKTWWADPTSGTGALQEPGVIELRRGRLFSWCRTTHGTQFGQTSRDGGETWSKPRPTPFIGACSPLCIKRIPSTGDLLAVWNDHSGSFPEADRTKSIHDRSPLVAAISTDDGKTWPHRKLIEGDPTRASCYTAIHFVERACLLAYSHYDQTIICNTIIPLRMRRITLDWLYG